MTWRIDGNHEAGSEVHKIRWELVPFMRGKALDLGCGNAKAFPHFIGVDNGQDTQLFGVPMKPQILANVEKLGMFASGEFDCVFSSHTLEHIKDYKATLREWWRLLKVGGYLCLYLPHADYYPQCGAKEEWKQWYEKNKERFQTVGEAVEALARERRAAGKTNTGEVYAGTPFCNPDHKHDFRPEDILSAMKSIGGGFDLVENQERSGDDEYSFLQVYKKTTGGVKESWKTPKPSKTCAIVRYGAIGDMIQMSTILPRLREQGYHITLYCQSGQGYESVKHDLRIDRFIIQDKDNVPPQYLTEFWNYTKKKYDRWINLSESVEGTLLACPDRVQFEWPNELRERYLDRNYLEWTHDLAEVPGPYEPMFYATKDEIEWAKKTAKSWGRRNVLWSLAGSSGHKVWPHVDSVIAAIMLEYPDTHVVLVGDESCTVLEEGWGKEPRVHCLSGKWSIRESLAFASYGADLVIGTETGLLNAVGCMDVQKIITLSHSSENMLTKHWKNVIVLRQPDGVGCPKQPCRQLHGAAGFDPWIDCPQHEETGSALCQFHVSGDMMWQAVRKVLGVQLQRRAA